MDLETKNWDVDEESEIDGILIDKQADIGKDSMLYKLQTDSWVYTIWGSVHLDKLMEDVVVGDHIIIKYTGMIRDNEYSMKRYELEVINDR
ncbi:MAG: hypothetical protein LUG89_04300 [Methanosphaera sp.]|nr:hypothetical protein [Methanosphaera sp.]